MMITQAIQIFMEVQGLRKIGLITSLQGPQCITHPMYMVSGGDQYTNKKDGVTGALGVKLSSYINDHGKSTLDITVITLYKDNYVEAPGGDGTVSLSDINNANGLVYDDNSYYYSRNYFYRTKIFIEKNTGASGSTADFNLPSTSSNTFGLNAHPGTQIKYTQSGGAASNIAKYLLMQGIEKGTDVATGGYAEIGWIALGTIEAGMKSGNEGDVLGRLHLPDIVKRIITGLKRFLIRRVMLFRLQHRPRFTGALNHL